MKYAIIHAGKDLLRDQIEKDLKDELKSRGFMIGHLDGEINFILNFTQFDKLSAVHRRRQNEFVVSIALLQKETDDLKYLCYNSLVQTLSNLFICVKSDGESVSEVYCITPEVGFYKIEYSVPGLVDLMLPVITAHFAINNRIRYDLPAKYTTTKITEELKYYGTVLNNLGVLPAPFPLHEVLSQENINHVYKIFNVSGLSYGNLSARERIEEVGENTFWMTARGVDKGQLKGVGKDILLVEGFDEKEGKILARIPAGSNTSIRVSVDAIEHLMIYQTFAEVGAIVHVHAWMKDILCTTQNFPCGTLELAKEVVGLLKTTPNPTRAVIGLKNHGLTITGNNLGDIFSRIEGKLLKEVPMMV
ncbi:MAG: class II aldolase/adducin family protein [Saprospiraceae bacterium]|nr:class II aldolase/adducin family protein [Saprospiraceae bacterium]